MQSFSTASYISIHLIVFFIFRWTWDFYARSHSIYICDLLKVCVYKVGGQIIFKKDPFNEKIFFPLV